MIKSLTNEEKLEKYDHAIFMSDQILRTILLHEITDLDYNSVNEAYLAGESKGIQSVLYRLTGDYKYNYTLRQLQDTYLEEQKGENK